MKIRKYTSDDKDQVVALLVMNIPRYFDKTEEEDFRKYLAHEVEDYFVVEEQNELIGAGGVNYFQEERKARISWDMINPNFHSKGIGSQLVRHRISHIKKNEAIDTIVVRTSQIVYRFYEKMNFKLVKIEKDFWAIGYDLYQMEIQLRPRV